MSLRQKILVVGPLEIGKTRLANLLAGMQTRKQSYTPTKGVRVLEHTVDIEGRTPDGNKTEQFKGVTVELWDCSGDRQYEHLYPAINKDKLGMIVIADLAVEDHIREARQYIKSFKTKSIKQVLVVSTSVDEEREPAVIPEKALAGAKIVPLIFGDGLPQKFQESVYDFYGDAIGFHPDADELFESW